MGLCTQEPFLFKLYIYKNGKSEIMTTKTENDSYERSSIIFFPSVPSDRVYFVIIKAITQNKDKQNHFLFVLKPA